MDFTGRIVLVTGSSSGIGEEIAIQFAQRGAQVIVTGRSASKTAVVVEKCNEASPGGLKAFGLKCDMCIDDDLYELVKKVIQEFEGVNILVNNAGISTYNPLLADDAITIYDTVMKTNLRAPFLLTHLLVPYLIKSKGNIINISSICSQHPYEDSYSYCMSKAALDMFTKCLTIELGPKGVRVDSVNPAAIRTPLFSSIGYTKEMLEALEEECKKEYPLCRIGEVNDVAKMVLFLASDDASFITGLIGLVDGGALQTVSGIENCRE